MLMSLGPEAEAFALEMQAHEDELQAAGLGGAEPEERRLARRAPDNGGGGGARGGGVTSRRRGSSTTYEPPSLLTFHISGFDEVRVLLPPVYCRCTAGVLLTHGVRTTDVGLHCPPACGPIALRA